MNQLRLTISEFWGGFKNIDGSPIVAFQSGYAWVMGKDARDNDAPVAPPFPYITYDLVRPDFGATTLTQASIWNRRQQPGHFGLVDFVLTQIQERIPHEGLLLQMDDGSGLVHLSRGAGNFIIYMGDPDDKLITRGIINLQITNFML